MGKKKLLWAMLLTVFLSMTINGNAYQEQQELEAINFNEEDTKYSFERKGRQLIIQAMGNNSASGLFVPKPELCLSNNRLSWSWRVDQLQPNADITMEDKEDFGASILVIFGKPSLFSKPKGLIYAFANENLPSGSVVNSPRAPDNFRTIILDNAQSPLMTWLQYERNILDDYEIAYGEMPDKELHTIGVFTDNDQTKEPVKASYNLLSCKLAS